MALSEEVLKKLITPNAKVLSSPNGEKIVDEGRVGSADDFDDSMFLAETYEEDPVKVSKDYQYDPYAAQILEARKTTDYSSNDFNPERVRNSNMLSAIKEEMVKHPIDTAALNTQLIESAGGGNPSNGDRLSKLVARAKQIDERAGKLDGKAISRGRVTESMNSGGGGIDYALIKTIVNECIETKLNEILQKGLLNEGTTLKGIGLSNGKIKIVDNKGNVYSAKLEYQGNTKDKK